MTRLICESSIENTSHSCLRFAFQRTLISFIIGSKLWPLDVLFLLGINMKFDHIVTWYDEHKKVEEFIYLISFPYLKKRTVYNLNISNSFIVFVWQYRIKKKHKMKFFKKHIFWYFSWRWKAINNIDFHFERKCKQ